MITKNKLTIGIIILSTSLLWSPFISAQTTEETITTESAEQLEIIDESYPAIECITGSEYDALTEQQQVDQELPLCDEYEVSTEELAQEAYNQETMAEQTVEVEICIPPLDYDSMTDEERAAVDAPLCDE